jgi:hypothetical protein
LPHNRPGPHYPSMGSSWIFGGGRSGDHIKGPGTGWGQLPVPLESPGPVPSRARSRKPTWSWLGSRQRCWGVVDGFGATGRCPVAVASVTSCRDVRATPSRIGTHDSRSGKVRAKAFGLKFRFLHVLRESSVSSRPIHPGPLYTVKHA